MFSQRVERSRAGPLRAGARISHYSPLPLLARQPSRLLARDLILVLAVLCSPPCVIMLHKSKKQHAEDGEREGGKESVPRLFGAKDFSQIEILCCS